MEPDEIEPLLQAGESETIEFKTSFGQEALETSGAFANTRGGVILIGVTNSGEVRGVQLGEETLANWANEISSNSEPRILPEIESIEIDGRNIVAVRIQELPLKPVTVRGRYFRRVENSNHRMMAQEVSEMHLASTGGSWDKLPAPHTSIVDIDMEKVKRYIRRANDAGRRKIRDDEPPLQVLEKLELTHEEQPAWAAILLFRKDAKRFLSQAAIHCGRFKEETVVVDDRMIEGTLIEQIDEAMDFIRKNIQVEFVMTGRPQREERWEYPLDALREALINAVCHRDYSIPSNTDIRIYDDHLIVWSPGGLPAGITLEELYGPHPSVLRNKGIAATFYDMGLVEQWGSGIEKMRTLCREAGLPEPAFEEQQGFRVIFRKDIYTEAYLQGLGLNERQIKAVRYVKEKGSINISTFKGIVPDVSEKTLFRDLKNLVGKGVFKAVGEKKGRKYEIA